eukprot:9875941-Alexandrium_andersonii.AAC.1
MVQFGRPGRHTNSDNTHAPTHPHPHNDDTDHRQHRPHNQMTSGAGGRVPLSSSWAKGRRHGDSRGLGMLQTVPHGRQVQAQGAGGHGQRLVAREPLGLPWQRRRPSNS